MKYVSERIVNIGELKGIIQKARLDSLEILEECKKNKPSIENIEGYANQMEAKLLTAENFDFLIERETTIDKLPVQGRRRCERTGRFINNRISISYNRSCAKEQYILFI